MNNTDTNMNSENTAIKSSYYTPIPLSVRERKVIEYAAQGMDNGTIAKILYVSSHTVKAHIASALRKLSATNRTHAVYIALKNNIIE